MDIDQFRGDELDITDWELPNSEPYHSEVINWTW